MGLRKHLRTIAIVLLTSTIVSVAPAVARTVVNYARNAGKVDGFNAVGAGASLSKRAGKLVATNKNGYLPNDIIRTAPNSDRLGGLPVNAYVKACGFGTIAGFAEVPGQVGANWTTVDGYSQGFESGGLHSPYGCNTLGSALARQVATGVYEVKAYSCTPSGPTPGQTLPAIVTIASLSGLVATYSSAGSCDSSGQGSVTEQVTIRALDGSPTSADFTIVTFHPMTVPVP